MLDTMLSSSEAPVHYTWDPSKPVGARLELAADCKDKVVSQEFLKVRFRSGSVHPACSAHSCDGALSRGLACRARRTCRCC
jgi:hypothetical protein